MTRQVKRIVAISALLLSLAIGAWMVQLHAHLKLWGHLPIFLFSAAWVCMLVLLAARWKAGDPRWRWLLLSSVAGILLAAGFPPSPLTPLMFVGFVPLLLAEQEIGFAGRKHGRQTLLFAYNTFVIWNILTTFWVANTAFVAGIVAIWLNSFFMAVPFWAFHITRRYLPSLAYLAFIAYWLSFELLHLNWEISWTWLNLGNAFAEYPAWVQWYEYTGTFGGSLWILTANYLIFKLVNQLKHTQTWPKVEVVRLLAVILLPIGVSVVRYFTYREQGKPAEVVVVQPNFEPHYQKFDLPEELQLTRFLSLSEQTLTPQTAYLVWPETSFGMLEVRHISEDEQIIRIREFLRKHAGLQLVTGVNSYKIFEPGEPLTPHTRESQRSSGTVHWELYNAAIQMTGDSATEIQHYKKSKLVPGAEMLPYRKLFFFLEPLVEKLDGSMAGHGTQPERTPFKSPVGQVAPVICYESVYGEYFTGYVRQGAQAAFIMTNDGWWDLTAGHRQHLRFASLRAIETRRDIARSANTGISGFVNQRGDVRQATRYGEGSAIRDNVQLSDNITFYVRWGDLIGRISLFVTLVLLLNTVVRFITSISSQRNPQVL